MLAGLQEFGKSDDLYPLLNEYEIQPWETWAIEEKVMHAPGMHQVAYQSIGLKQTLNFTFFMTRSISDL